MSDTRKRSRSTDESFGLQTKHFVNQQKVDLNSSATMKIIFDKTISLLYAGAQIHNQTKHDKMNNNKVEIEVEKIDGGKTEVDEKVIEKLPDVAGCNLCLKQLDVIAKVCHNCNLKICRDCLTFCSGCDVDLCVNCVNIFGCALDDFAICEECKQFVDY